MNVCDICKNPSAFEKYVYNKPTGYGKKMDLCGRCYKMLEEKENVHRFLAYQEVISEVTQQPAKQTWRERLGFKK